MTLVAGFLCSDGYVLAADTEMTYDVIRFQGKKLTSYAGFGMNYGLRVGFAGDANYATMLSQKIADGIHDLGDQPKLPDMKRRVEEAVQRIHEDQIFKVWAATGQQEPSIELIVALEDVDGRVALLKTVQTAVFQVMGYAFAGTGSYLAEYLCQRLIGTHNLPTAVTHHLVHQLFREIKGKGIYVGGNTEIVSARTDPKAEQFFLLRSDEDPRFLWGLEQVLYSAIRLALRKDSYPQFYQDRLEFIRGRLDELWRYARMPRTDDGVERVETVHDTEWGNSREDM
jgi:hypothetical protein